MKTIIKEISKWTSIIISVLMFAVACSDDKEDGAPEEPAPAAPTITDFVPPHGVPGVTITITGTGLKEANEVTIGGKQVELTGEATDTEIKVVTTEEVTGGKIRVTTPYGTVETVSEFVVDAVFQTPSLTVVPQDNVSYWDIITLEGENLDIVEKVFFGTVEARIIREDEATRAVEGASGTELKVEVPYYDTTDAVNIFLEYTNEDNESVKMDTQKSFTVTPRAPKLDAVSSIDADFFDQISLTGTDLHLVEKVIFGTTEAVIDKENSNSTVLKVTVPYYEEEEPVSITLVYRYGAEDNVAEGRRSESSDKFAAKKVQPENVECPAKIMLGDEFDITGTNLDKIEKVLFNETEITAKLSEDKTKLTCSLPGTVTEASTGNKISIKFWQGNGVKEIRDDFEVKVLATYIWKNLVMYALDDTREGHEAKFLSGTTGRSYTLCDFADNRKDIHLNMNFSNKTQNEVTTKLLRMETSFSNGGNFGAKVLCGEETVAKNGWRVRFMGLPRTTAGVAEYMQKIDDGTFETEPLSTEKIKADIKTAFTSTLSYKEVDGVVAPTAKDCINIGDLGLIALVDAGNNPLVIGIIKLNDADFDGKYVNVDLYFPKGADEKYSEYSGE